MEYIHHDMNEAQELLAPANSSRRQARQSSRTRGRSLLTLTVSCMPPLQVVPNTLRHASQHDTQHRPTPWVFLSPCLLSFSGHIASRSIACGTAWLCDRFGLLATPSVYRENVLYVQRTPTISVSIPAITFTEQACHHRSLPLYWSVSHNTVFVLLSSPSKPPPVHFRRL